ncbi:Malectin-like carbohydrate-binding domain-containing protein [Cinnamomum micranthum f. kanehirae]|uniref:Malectin-like carbohydrate-binding domain-containing protein n=1 Tax=Cinnamomum micranthum f. kanehirae TaxID=337451 RepID=A0A443PXL2_9MAGN|nr:Malectin-like carbohydrate-binding domain-containing protein [Cinnamomum micranthum f. kanehirae]
MIQTTVFISIDCGATNGHVDENNIRWVGDDQYIKTGERHVAMSANNTVMSTLRVFSSPKKNCYTIGIEQGTRILVRAGSFYGNYDKQSLEPSFDLKLDGNYWNTVTTSIDNVKFYEAIYVPKGNTSSVCVAQTIMGNIPFISSLEVRSFDLEMYSSLGVNYPSFLFQRNMMATNGIVRFPDDPYDRIWNPDVAQNGFTKLTTEANITAAVKDKPPPSALRTAVTPADQTSSTSIIYTNTSTRASSGSFYINIYFSEVTKLASTDKRAFEIFGMKRKNQQQ